jgi:large subunit ribosomal protein L25
MAKQIQLKVKTRTETGKGQVKRLRAGGLVPGVVYGTLHEPLNVTVGAKELGDTLDAVTSENVLVDLQVESAGAGAKRLALIQDVQHHPVTDAILHIDFHEVSATEKLRTAVAVRGLGEAAGVKTGGGILEYVMRELRVECLPQDLPDVIEVNVEKMEIGQSIHVGDIPAPAGVTFLDGKDQAVFIVAAPITEEEEAALGTPAEAGEPEVIGAVAEGEEGEAAAGEGEAKKGEAKPGAAAPAKGEAKAGAAPAGKADAKAGAAAGKAPAAAAGKAPAGAAAKAPAAGGKAPAGKPEGKK